jgi:hypothetical protein
MSRRNVHRITSALLSILALSAGLPFAADAEEYLNQGIKLFNQKQYNASRPYFDKAAENAPWDSNAFYYQALAAQYCRDFGSAKKLWAKIIEKFPGTPAAANATQAMRALDPAYFTRPKAGESGGSSATASTSSGGSKSGASSGGGDDDIETKLAAVQYQAPAQSRIPLTRAEGRPVIAGSVNGRSVSFEFSGGTTSLSAKDARNSQITKPDRTPVKAGERVAVNVKIGDITASSFPILVDDSDKSKLGDDFFRKFTYQLDPQMLIVAKKESSGGGKTAYDVPFRRSGKDMMVDLTINGRRVSMIFDPSSETVVPSKRVREFGLDVQTNTEMAMYDREKGTGPMRGEAGFGEEKVKSTAEAKVCIGPVQNQLVTVHVDEKVQQPKIGTDALGGWKYTVDQGASLIRFSR